MTRQAIIDRRWILAASLLLVAGCAPAATSSPQPAQPTNLSETWDAIYLQGEKVGAVQTTIESEERDGKQLVRTTSKLKMAVMRAGQPIRQEMFFTSLEDPQGRVVEFETRISAGPTPLVTRGTVQGDKLFVTVNSGGKESTSTLPWSETNGGLFAVEQSLARRPLQPGESRSLRLVTPGLALPDIVEAKLVAGAIESTEHLGTPRELLAIRVALVHDDGQQIEQQIWTDEAGQVLKQLSPNVGQATYRTTREIAAAGADSATFDLLNFSVVKAPLSVPQPHATRQAVYRVRLKEANPAKVFPQGATQQVVAVDDHTADITVTAIRAAYPATIDPRGDRQPNEDDINPNSLIESDDEAVKLLAANVPENESDPVQVARALEKLVRSNMKLCNYSQAFATAAQVARSREGDCTEHSVLLAALMRARGIPARVAMGLVYYPEGRGFAFHMWTEAWLNGRWVPFDATLARGGIGAAHLKVSDSNLKGANATGAFLPVLQLLGQMEMEVKSVE